MTNNKGYYGKVVGISGKHVKFDCGACHFVNCLPDGVEVGQFIMIDIHGRVWGQL